MFDLIYLATYNVSISGQIYRGVDNWMDTDIIIGREKELEILESALDSPSAEFIAVYGRRRVGKTYLIKQFYSRQSGILFELTGIKEGALKVQQKNFSEAFSHAFYQGAEMATPKNWMDALKQLTIAIDKTPKNKRITLFFDELPWLASRKSGFLSALEHFWNTQWTYRKKLILVVCGSAASWMLENVVYAKGGLHNRISQQIPLAPFDLHETSLYLRYRKLDLTEQQILQLYMVMGGVPHYLSKVKRNLSITQNINMLCFEKNGALFKEFEQLFHSLYDEPEIYIGLIRAIAKKAQGISRDSLIENMQSISTGGRLSIKLRNLEEAGFISAFVPLGHARKGIHYKIIDEYVLFYLKWIEPYRKKNRSVSSSHYWTTLLHTPAWYTWAGYAFEAVCLKHIEPIKKALKIEKTASFSGSWFHIATKTQPGTQIDLVFDRNDDCITLCEIKYTDKTFLITKQYAKELENKKSIYQAQTKTKKQIFWCLITNNGAGKNEYYKQLIAHTVNTSDLFSY